MQETDTDMETHEFPHGYTSGRQHFCFLLVAGVPAGVFRDILARTVHD